jgi:hypothetical protein
MGKVSLAPFQLSQPNDKFSFVLLAEKIRSQDLTEKVGTALAGRDCRT